ncbi:hypothetical protein AXF42_Ash018544 [Apostasia shenzhenica]|uniref:Uncharacterized protein n=1 Tax=Apostasia shenzhenica TaxID=1088818 RepID=A0A2I0APU1_9ASPA|nr:hypothetical protein AXF42_Ash018544 [Apostasia shenzhenica]
MGSEATGASERAEAEDAPAAAAAAEGSKEISEPVTPKSEDSILKAPIVCPPAPRKPRPAARRKPLAELQPNVFEAALRDLSSVFAKRPAAPVSPVKRIRLI